VEGGVGMVVGGDGGAAGFQREDEERREGQRLANGEQITGVSMMGLAYFVIDSLSEMAFLEMGD